MVFVSDRATGEPVPYLPVSATIRAAGKPARTVKLSPMIGGQGFHYGVNVTVPDGAHTITVAIGPRRNPGDAVRQGSLRQAPDGGLRAGA